MSRQLLAHVCLLLCALPLLLAASLPGCDESDYEVSYTECHQPSNTRDLIWYLTPNANCTPSANYTPPANVYGLPCSISCAAGYYLPLGEVQCAPCKEGTFSIGGGFREDTWYTWPSFFNFNRYYVPVNTAANPVHNSSFANVTNSPQWSLFNGVLRSGHVNNSQSSVLELSVYVISSTAHVTFSYRVNAEHSGSVNWDGLQFDVDGTIWLPKTSYVPNFVTVTHALTPGFHVLRWSYIKDVSLNAGEDAAFIKMIEVGGMFFADDSCEVCPPGYFTSGTASTICQPCPANTYANNTEGNPECLPCGEKEYSYTTSPSCTHRQPCTTDDFEYLNTSCLPSGTRTQKAVWLTPLICDFDSYTLPADTTGLSCGACTDGATRSTTTQRCAFCPDGEYSTGGAPCQACAAGTVATKSYTVDRFYELLSGWTSDCSGDCTGQGWVPHGSYVDSGVGHGNSLVSWLSFSTDLLTAGTISFSYQLFCPSLQCSLELLATPGDRVVINSQATTNFITTSMNLAAGSHVLNFTFSKFGFTNNRTDRAAINRIVITHADEGGAVSCTKCTAGTYSVPESTHCEACPAGQQSNSDFTACVPCPAGTHNPTPGAMCFPCGNGTSSSADGTGCVVTCAFYDGFRQYNLTALRNDTVSYGPINSTIDSKQFYYINVCEMSPDRCYATKDTMIHSYGCQQTTVHLEGNLYEGMDIGNIFGWAPLSNNGSRLGVRVDLTYGTMCAASSQTDKHRQSHITFLCDPLAGVGYPTPGLSNGAVESPTCVYNFEWRSKYACPICDASYDMGVFYSPCQQGKRTKSYYWTRNPPSCQGSLLPDLEVSCNETSSRCPGGTVYNDITNKCDGCAAGTYSVGGGEHIMSWAPLPTRFTTSATPWIAGLGGVETIGSGAGNTSLTATFQFVVVGALNFQYKLYATQSSQRFTFSINGEERLHLQGGLNKMGWNSVGIPLTPGVYAFTWAFSNGVTNAAQQRAGVVLKGVTLVGTDYHDDTCTPCPAGFHSAANATSCSVCAMDRVSQGDAAVCTACAEDEYAFPRAATCTPRAPCTTEDWTYWYGDCQDGTRSRTPEYLEPRVCLPVDPLPESDRVECAACPPGTSGIYTDGIRSCQGCPAGQVMVNGACKNVSAGSITIPRQYTFADISNDLPEGWTTSCSGDCSNTDTNGWRLLADGALDAGFHGSNAVDVLLKFSGFVGDFGSLSFDYEVASVGRSGLNLYSNNVLVTDFTGTSSYTYSLPKGGHNLTWNYYQVSGAQGRAKISNVTLTGAIASNVGAIEQQCPAGSYSVDGTSCALCPPGSKAEAPGSSSCTLCDKETYNGEWGATTCKDCNGGTYTNGMGATFCLSDCRFSSEVKGRQIEFGLDAVGIYGPLTVGANRFVFNLCNASLGDAPCAPKDKPSRACATGLRDQDYHDWGSDFNFQSTHESTQEIYSNSSNPTFLVTLSGGDSTGCPNNVKRSMKFQFYCDTAVKTGTPTPVASTTTPNNYNNSCTAVFDWISIMGCPLCTDNDYVTVYGQCVDGMKTAQRTRLVACNGKEVEALASQACANTVEFPLGVVFVVVGIIVALIVVAVIVFVKNRKISAQYSRLKLQGAGGSELDASSDTIHNL